MNAGSSCDCVNPADHQFGRCNLRNKTLWLLTVSQWKIAAIRTVVLSDLCFLNSPNRALSVEDNKIDNDAMFRTKPTLRSGIKNEPITIIPCLYLHAELAAAQHEQGKYHDDGSTHA